jgi:hypothetical protein
VHFKDSENLRLRVHVTLETESGERITEVKDDAIIPGLFCENALNTAEQAFDAFFQTKVESPARSLVRAHLRKLEAQRPFYRTDDAQYLPPEIWPDDEQTAAALDAKLMAVLNRR